MAVCKLVGESPVVYFTDGADHEARDRQAVRDAAATVIHEETQQAASARKANTQD